MINKVKINPIDRINRIAMTGDIEDPKPLSPVDNIMQHYPKTQETPQEDGGFWNGLKNFAGSKGGRMLIGGLGTAAAVGLTGGGLQNALGYGVIGAGKTAENIYNQEQDQKAWEEKEAERLFRQQESEANRKQQWDIAQANINAQKDARQDAYKHAETMLGLNKKNAVETEIAKLEAVNDYKKEQILANPTLSDEQKQFAISRLNSDFDYDAYYTDKYYNGTPEQQAEAERYLARKTSYNNLVNPWDNLQKGANIADKGGVVLNPEAANEGRIEFVAKPQKLSDAQFAYQEALKRGEDPLTAARTSGLDQFYNNEFELKKAIAVETEKHQNEMKKQKDAQEHGVYMAGVNQGNDLEKLGYQHNLEQQGKEEDLRRAKDLERFKNSLPEGEMKEYQQISAETGIPLDELYMEALEEKRIATKNALAEVKKRIAERKRAEAQANLYSNQAQNVKNPNTPSFSELQTGVNNGTITAETGNQLYGQDVFQQPLSKEETELNKQRAKNQAAQEKAAQQVENMMPRVKDAIERAYKSLDEGTGLGQVGGWGWTTDTGGINRANIQNAQAQINTLMRGILSSMGVGATEMNSAVEAAAYRYMITPDMPVAQIRQVLDNFIKDYTSGALMQNIYDTASAFGGAGADGGYGMPIGTIDGDYRYIGGDPKFEKSWELIQ